MSFAACRSGESVSVQTRLVRLLRACGSRLSPLLQFFAIVLVTMSAVRAELVNIPAPHLGDGKTLRVQWFTPDAKTATGAAAILLHGCGGLGANGNLNARHKAAKDWLIERGIAVAMPESFTSRGFDEVCTIKMQSRTITQSDRVKDVIATRSWLDAQPGVDAKKVVLWGWSHGGGTTLATITHRVGDVFPDDVKFAQAIAFYPGCSSYLPSARVPKISSPLLLLIGEADDWTPAAPCVAWVEQLRQYQQDATITVYPGAFHDFDNPAGKFRIRADVPNGVKKGKGVTVAPDPKAREDAMAKIDALLRKRGLVP